MSEPCILFVCTGNAGRSQIAAAMLRSRVGKTAQVISAGVRPWERLHPMTEPTLARRSLSAAGEHPKSIEDACDRAIDLVVTIGDIAEKELPRELPGGPQWVHWDIADPADFDGTNKSEAAFEDAAKSIEEFLPVIVQMIPSLVHAASDDVLPIRSQSHVLDYSKLDQEPLELVRLGRMRLFEAEMARAKLESEGIACFVRDANVAVAHSLLFNEVPLLVDKKHLDRARAILDRLPSDDEEGEYVDEPWRCPKCHRKSVEFQPLTRGLWIGRVACVTLLLLPLVMGMARLLIGSDQIRRSIDRLCDAALLPWLVGTMVLISVQIFARRGKRCKECGHQWNGDDAGNTAAREDAA